MTDAIRPLPLSTVILPLLLALVAMACQLRADEGMWLFNDLPREQLAKYSFSPDEEWANHLMLSSVRFNSGGSASFVSSNGLVLTNHHVAADTLHKLSTPDRNILEDGFLAQTYDEEIPAPDLELNQLVSIEDVTDRVNRAVPAGMPPADAFKARQAVMAQIEKESLDATGFRSDVVTLYGGAKYHLYRYKKYTDVRVVWAPESAIAFFGGDADNFEFPRYNLDATLFRVYENGQPAKMDHFLRWSPAGAADGELVFVSGNPGRTQRIFTLAALKFLRDHRLPFVLDFLRRREVMLQQFSLENEESRRRAQDELMGIENARKAYLGMLQGLQDPGFLARKQESEQKILGELRQRPDFVDHAAAWDSIASAQQRRAEIMPQSVSLRTRMYDIAEKLVLMASEDKLPSAERLREFRDSNRESLELDLFSPAPIYEDLERANLADALAYLAERRGGDDPIVQQALAGKGPQARAAELIQGTKLLDPEYRRTTAAGGGDAIINSSDPLIQLARTLEPEYRRLRQVTDELDEQERQAYAKITEAMVALQGTSGYPDATFTLRLSFGVVKGFDDHGTWIPPWTTVGGAFAHEERHGAKKPWALPPSWHNHRDAIDHSTPFNFVSTVDIIGGNSGSPLVNRHGQLVGLIFDGNLQSLTSDYVYSDVSGRAVAVHSSVIPAALRAIYGAPALAEELGR